MKNSTRTISIYYLASKTKAIINLLRPHHWVKNLFLFAPIFFAGEFFDFSKIVLVFNGFVAFSLVASSIYIINDYKDIEDDRVHPVKCVRPLACGEISKTLGLILFFILVIAGFSISYFLDIKFMFILGLYFIMNIGYSFGLKNISILDVIIVSIGFILRVKAGGTISDIYVTEWLIIMIFLLALFMAFAKRRDDILLKLDSDLDVRKSVKGYNLEFLTTAMTLITAIALVSYLIYTLSPSTQQKFQTHRLYYTFIFVLGGVLRYLQIIYLEKDSGSPVKIFYKDRFVQACVILWILSYAFIIYFPEFTLFK